MASIIYTEIIIRAPLKEVWNILIDLDRYNEWNPFTPKVETDLKLGSPVMLHVQMKPGKKILQQKEQMMSMIPEKEISWGIPENIWIAARRTQRLEHISDDQTRYVSEDKFTGILVPLVMLLYRKHVQRGFDETAVALKSRAEHVSMEIS